MSRAARACALSALVAGAAAFEPLPWDEAYKKAEATLARMTVPLIEVSGLCQKQIFADGLLFQPHGHLEDGSPYYGVGGMYLYFEPSSYGKQETKSRWILSETEPHKARSSDFECAGTCNKTASVECGSKDTLPLGKHTWLMQCGHTDTLSEQSVTLREVPQGEKYTLLRGLGWEHPLGDWFNLHKWWYIGNTPAIPRLDIPSLNMQDAAGGFRTMWTETVGSATVFPSLLAMAATWNDKTVFAFGQALGKEFSAKGANAILGPSVNVHRVARNGRNFEYMSGDDPMLGAALATAYVKGVQSHGIFAVVKHWVFNSQETHRGAESSDVDDKTSWELYYPPFQAAVDAGVGAAMCSYNKVSGEYSCANKKTLDDLHNRMGFKGFVQSDWWATHSNSIENGLDQEMPGTGSGEGPDGHREYFDADELEDSAPAAVDLAAKRILAVIYRYNLAETTKCAPPNCKEYFLKDVGSPDHAQLARRAAAESIVLLKNDNKALPLCAKSVKHIAIIGAAADAPSYDPDGQGQGQGDWAQGDYYSGGGSGHLAGKVVTPFDGLGTKAGALGIKVSSSLTDDVDAAVKAARHVDVAIVVVATTSGESRDRKDLNLDGDVDALIEAVRKVAKKIVVLVEAPGPVVMPWRKEVDGVAIMFLGGQETGNAWADVIFGDQAPAGRLPIMLPETEADTIPPDSADDVPYSEGIATSYRNPSFKAAFPFGHGLTYTTFQHKAPVEVSCYVDSKDCRYHIRSSVTNAGKVAAPAVVQLYLEFPPQAGQTAPIMKAFKKTDALQPGSSEEFRFALSAHDLSYWDLAQDGWVEATGTFVAHLGESSADIKHSLTFCNGPCTPGGGTNVAIIGLGAAAMALGSIAIVLKTLGSRAPAPYSSGAETQRLELAPLTHDA